MSFNKAQTKEALQFLKGMLDRGVINDDELVDLFCHKRKQVMRRQRAQRKTRRGWA